MKIANVFSVIALVASCVQREVPPGNAPNLEPLSSAEVDISSANNDFGFKLFRDIQAGNAGANVFISPLSIGMALGMTLNGANDSTRASILKTIQFGGLQSSDVNKAYHDLSSLLTGMDRTVTMDLANSVWYDKNFTVIDTFANVITNSYSGTIQSLDFSSASSPQIINSWVASKTNNQIQNLITNIDPTEVMFLVNAVYFKGTWTYQFDASQTKAATFNGENGSSQQVQMMDAKKPLVNVFFGKSFTLVDIPYGNKEFSMTVLLPDAGYTVDQLTARLSADSLTAWLGRADSVTRELKMPKFRIGWKSDLLSNLQDLGMEVNGFPHFFHQPFHYSISRVIHQSSISVDEQGSEAAAATAVGISATAVEVPPPPIILDRPFLYVIREKHSGVILFMGQMYSPASD